MLTNYVSLPWIIFSVVVFLFVIGKQFHIQKYSLLEKLYFALAAMLIIFSISLNKMLPGVSTEVMRVLYLINGIGLGLLGVGGCFFSRKKTMHDYLNTVFIFALAAFDIAHFFIQF